jgi:hypothetical protein
MPRREVYRARPVVGACEKAIARLVSNDPFVGSAEDLAFLVSHPVKRVWYALLSGEDKKLYRSIMRAGGILHVQRWPARFPRQIRPEGSIR